MKDVPLLYDWLEENYEAGKYLRYSDRILFLNCEEESVKREFILVFECFFKGHCFKFLEWSPNFHLEKVDCMIPSWFIMPSLPPELCQIDIIKSIGSALGEFRGIDASFFCCNNIKVLINTNFNHSKDF